MGAGDKINKLDRVAKKGIIYSWIWNGSKFIQDKELRQASDQNSQYGYQLTTDTPTSNYKLFSNEDGSEMAAVPFTIQATAATNMPSFIENGQLSRKNILDETRLGGLTNAPFFNKAYPDSLKSIH